MRSSLPSYENQNIARRSTSADRLGATGRLAGQGSDNQLSSGTEWRMQLSVSQLVVLWSILAGVMVLVFLFGLYAGREQGLTAALEEYRQSGARIPIADPQAFAESSQEMLAALDPTATTELKAAPGRSASSNESTSGSVAGTLPAAAKDAFDFSEEGKVSRSALPPSDAGSVNGVAAPSTSAGAAAAPPVPAGGLELFKSDTVESNTGTSTGTSTGTPTGASVADRKAAEVKAGAEAKASKRAAERQKRETEAKTAAASGKADVPKSSPTQKSNAVASKETAKLQQPARATAPVAGPASGWYVQIAATRAQNQADDVVDQSRRQGFDPVIEVATVRESRYYRVLIGPYQTRELALNAKAEAKRKSLSRTEPFLKRIK